MKALNMFLSPIVVRIIPGLILLAVMGCSDQSNGQTWEHKPYRHGPHVIVDGDKRTALYFDKQDSNWTVQAEEVEGTTAVLVENPLFAPFEVKIRDDRAPSPATYPAADRLLVIADIEGNFAAFYALLVAQEVIDRDGNWTFGTDHLVMLGDLYDRGPDVTPLLWLLYKLESEATEAGGRVHVLLGNHEMMIFEGDTRYIHPKYRQQSMATGIAYPELYSTNTILGRWMRSMPSIIRIGDVLFSHAGVSPEVLELQLALEEMNALVRAANADTRDLTMEQVLLLGLDGIFWYRGWVDDPPPAALLDTILETYDAAHMVIGHTIVPEITGAFDHKLIMTDLQQSSDLQRAPARALLIDKGEFYQVDSNGGRALVR